MKKKPSRVREKDDMRPEFDFAGGIRGKYAKRFAEPASRDPDEMLPEYDFSKGRPNPYAAQLRYTIAVVLAPDVAKRFRTARAVNDALRSLAAKPKRRGAKTPTKRRSP